MSDKSYHKQQVLSFDKTEWKQLFQGAESRVYTGQFKSQPAILKERFIKTYRLPELDQKLTKERIRSELKAYEKILKKCKELGQNMAAILYSDDRNIVLTEIPDAINVSHYFKENEHKSPELVEEMLKKLGIVVAQIHSCGIVHGDLTTSNFLVRKDSSTTNDIVIPIDFGLSSSTTSDEDRAVDLYVLERAIESTHPSIDFKVFIDSYNQHIGTDKINKKLDAVRTRGRKRLMIG